MGFPYGADDDIVDVIFPRYVRLTVRDFLSGILYDESNDDDDGDGGRGDDGTMAQPHVHRQRSVSSRRSGASRPGSSTSTKRAIQYFQKYVDDVYNGKIGSSEIPVRFIINTV